MVHIPSQRIPGGAGRGILCRCSLRGGGWSKCHRKPLSVITFSVMGVVSATVTICLIPTGTHSGQRIARWAWKQTYNIYIYIYIYIKKDTLWSFQPAAEQTAPDHLHTKWFLNVWQWFLFYFWDSFFQGAAVICIYVPKQTSQSD